MPISACTSRSSRSRGSSTASSLEGASHCIHTCTSLDHFCFTHFLGEVDWCSTGCTASWCVCCFVFIKPTLGNCYGPGVIPEGRGPGVAASLPFTLTTSLATPVPSSSSSNGSTTTPLTTRGFCPGGSVVWAGPKFVRPHW